MKTEKPNCYKCVHRLKIPGDAHSSCNNVKANVEGERHGIVSGWFFWPFNFDPAWLISCDGFSNNKEDIKPENKDPIFQLLRVLR